jgi:GT2 family glycosyltransferase
MKKVRIVTVTARNQVEFWGMTLLGQSLRLFPKKPGLEVSVLLENSGRRRRGLAALYNTFFQSGFAGEILLFVHDDVYVHDWHLSQRLNDAAAEYDVVGLAGNTQPDYDEPSWALAWNRARHPRGWQPLEYFSGVVAHIVGGRTVLSEYGPAPRDCGLLDGLLLAVDADRALETGVRFDPQFEFHFYDLDFCRTCHANGMRIGTWPIAVTHGSPGDFASPEWKASRDRYLRKWGAGGVVRSA